MQTGTETLQAEQPMAVRPQVNDLLLPFQELRRNQQ